MITAIILAAGQSIRMGTPKQLLAWQDGTILGRVVRNLLESRLDQVIVVLGHQAELVGLTISHQSIRVVVNPDYRQGMGSSIRAGMAAVPADSATMIVLGDQPLIGAEIIDRLMQEFREGGRGIIVPTHRGTRGHPVLFDARYRGELLSLGGDVGGRGILAAHPADVAEVEVESAAILGDIDDIEDYQSLVQELPASKEWRGKSPRKRS